MRFLIFTLPHDAHADLVEVALNELGHEVHRFLFSEYPSRAYHDISLSNDSAKDQVMVTQSPPYSNITDMSYDAIWLRRPNRARFGMLDPAPDEIQFLQMTHARNLTATMALLSDISWERSRSRWVNPHAARQRADLKPTQLREAVRCGFIIPRTLISNNPESIGKFQKECGGEVILKAYFAHSWEENKKMLRALTSVLPDISAMPRESVRLQPAIYQERIRKRCELRWVYFQGLSFVMQINSQGRELTSIDWREGAIRSSDVEPFSPSRELTEKVERLMRSLGLVAGSLDFIIRDDGEVVFLEVNESGQFLFVEELIPAFHILDAFSSLLEAKTENFNAKKPRIRLKDAAKHGKYASLIEREASVARVPEFGL